MNPSPSSDGSTTSAHVSRRAWLGVAAIAVLQTLLLLHTAWDKSDTADEPHYLSVAVRQWQGDLLANCESPALPKWGFGLALRLVDGVLFDASAKIGRDPLYSRPLAQTRRNLMAARSMTVAVTVSAGVLLFLSAGRFGVATGLLAQALWAASPGVLANGSLATLDAWAASGSALALFLGLRLVERPGAARAALLGAALATAAACKVTTLGLVPLAVIVVLWATRRLRPALQALSALALGFVVMLWVVYGLHVATLDTAVLCGRTNESLVHHTFGPLPFTPWIEGLLQQFLHGETGHRSYLFGQVAFTGWWWFYLAAIALKTTLGAQVLVGLRLASWLRARPAAKDLLIDAALLAYPLLLLIVMSAGRAQNGIKYLLPAFPLVLVWLARTLGDARRAFARFGTLLTLGLTLLAAAESLRVHPHHLMFFNLWAGGPEGGPRYLIVGDDWGQDQLRLAEWQREERPWRLYYTRYNGDPHHWGVSYEPPPCEPKIGFYALQAIEVHRPKRMRSGCLDWLTVEEPDARLGYSIYLYQVDKARIERLTNERGSIAPFWQTPAAPELDDDEPEAGMPQ
jgi:hypothetical protein